MHLCIQASLHLKKPFTIHHSLRSPRHGMTLAEVLITLCIIGVVAGLTVPALNNAIQDMEYKTAYKKAFSTINQAFLSASQNNEIIPMTGTYSSQGMEANFAAIQQYFKVTKSCTNSSTQRCWEPTGERWRTENASTTGFIDNSGMTWKLRNTDVMAIAPIILVDTNGFKSPNKYGEDRFPLALSSGNSTDQFLWLNVNPVGMPTKIASLRDIPTTESDSNYRLQCPSYATHACYNTTWLMP